MNFTTEINKLVNQVQHELSTMDAKEANMDNVEVRCGNIYFIYENDVLKYIGQQKIKDIKSRLQNHFTGNGEEHVLLAYPPQDQGTEVKSADEADSSKWEKFRINPDKPQEGDS